MTAMPPPFFSVQRIKMIGARRSALEQARGRLVFVSVCFAIAYILVAARLVDLSFLQGYLLKAPAQEAGLVEPGPSAAPVVRADITDRNGVLLATSLETASLYADPVLINEPEEVARGIVAVLPHLSYGDVLQKLQRPARFVWIDRNITPDEQFGILELGQPGLAFKKEMRRIYPQGRLAAHIVGFTSVDGAGLAGIERSFNKMLRDGGEPLRLSLDIRLQHVLHRETKDAIETFGAKGGAAAIVDIATGEILAGVSLPDFDPHDPAAADSQALFNRLTLGVYELGSTFKVFSTAALIENKRGAMGMSFDASEPIRRGRFTISDFHAQDRILSVPEVFMYSSNIGAALMGEMVGTDALRDFYNDLGLLSPLALEIDEVGAPLYPQPWRDINTLTVSYGHGIAVSPLQMLMAVASVAGDGTLVKPTLIYGGHAAEKTKNNPAIRVVSPQTVHRMRQLMRLVVTDGTGTQAEVPGYRVGGKTGTADKAVHGSYDRSKRISSFVGVFPVDAPRYAVFIMVAEPKGTKDTFGYATGGWVAAPAVGRVVTAMASILGIEPAPLTASDDMSAALKSYINLEPAGGDHGHH